MDEEREVKNNDETSVIYDSEMTSDKFFAAILANLITARLFFEYVLSKRLLRRLDLSTLEHLQPRLVAPDGKEHIGDFFFKAKYRTRRGKDCGGAVFVIVLEHKFEDELYVSIQLLRYTANLLGVMRANRNLFADQNGRLPTPYPIVFSQDWQRRKTYFLRDVLSWIPGLRKTVPNFWYQHFRISEKKLESIRECEPLLGFFLYLERLARKKVCEPNEEREQLADFVYRCSTRAGNDPRMQDGTAACSKYLRYIRTFRPDTPSDEDVLTKIEERTGTPMNFLNSGDQTEFLATVFPTAYKRYCDIYDAKAKECDIAMRERDALVRSCRKRLLYDLTSKYNVDPSDDVCQKIASVSDCQTLDRIQDVLWNEEQSYAEIRREIEEIIANVPSV